MRDIYINVTVAAEVLTEDAQKRINEHNSKTEDSDLEPKDESGHTAEWFRDLALPVPKDLEKAEAQWVKRMNRGQEDEQGYQTTDEDFVELYRGGFFPLKDFRLAVANFDEGSTIFLKGNYTLDVLEDVDEIYGIIHYETRGRCERITDWFYFKWINIPFIRRKRLKKINDNIKKELENGIKNSQESQ